MGRDKKKKQKKTKEQEIDPDLKLFLDQFHSVFILDGISPTSPEHKTITCSFLEWNIVVSIYAQMLMQFGKFQIAEAVSSFLLQPQFNYPKDDMEYNSKQMLDKEGFLPPRIEAAIKEWNTIISPHGKSLNLQDTFKNIMDIMIFVSNNPGGFEGKLVAMPESTGPWRIAESDDPVEKMKATVFQEITKEIVGDQFQQILIGNNPLNEKYKEIAIERAYWMVGFSSLCIFSSTEERNNPDLSKIFIEKNITTLMGASIEIDTEINDYLRKMLEELLVKRRSMFLEMVLKSWTNPQVIQYAISNEGKFSEKMFVDSMLKLLSFMKSNSGFKT
jgi:hypothetical protein